jgi:fatty acid-binding protein DegV
VITDSASSLPAELIRRWNITVVPLRLRLGGEERREPTPP